MALPTDPDGLATAWRALTGSDDREGWRSTELVTLDRCRILAVRRMPEDREGVLVGFRDDVLPATLRLPSGRGFLVEQVRDAPAGFFWIALSRRDGAGLDLFTTMVHDIVHTLRTGAPPSIEALLRRIHLWQDFMSRGSGALLGPEEEIGLFGELHVLELLLEHVPHPAVLLEAWTGPAGGLHDFVFGSGAIEVKTTLSSEGFRATIASLEQLDPAVRSPLHVAAVRLAARQGGLTLPEQVARLRERFPSGGVFDIRLLQAGYLAGMAEHHVRRFVVPEFRLIEVDGRFPHLTPRSVPAGILSARYTIELDTTPSRQPDLSGFLRNAGVAYEP